MRTSSAVIPAGLHIEGCIQRAQPIRAGIVGMNTKGLQSELLLHCQVLPIPCSYHLCPPEDMQKQRAKQEAGSRLVGRKEGRTGRGSLQEGVAAYLGCKECKKAHCPSMIKFQT